MKKEGFDYWDSPNTGATNISGFSGLGAGYRNGVEGTFLELKLVMVLCTPTDHRARADHNKADLIISTIANTYGYFLRLVKD